MAWVGEGWLGGEGGGLIGRGRNGETQLKQIFANSKRKVLFELTGKVVFEGEGLEIKLEDVTCTGDREYSVKGKVKEERERVSKVAGKLV